MQPELDIHATRPKTSVVFVTPAMAERWMERNTSNRAISPITIERYRRDMASGLWHLTHEGIAFDTDGALVDGQHRLLAIMKLPADTSIATQVTTGAAPESRYFVNQGRKRNAGGQLQIAHVRNANQTAAGARFFMIWKQGLLFRDHKNRQLITTPQIQNWVEDNILLVEFANDHNGPLLRNYATPSVSRAAFFAFTQIDPDAACVFFAKFSIGADLSIGNPILALRNRLESDFMKRINRTDREQLGAVIRAWNQWRAGKTLKTMDIKSWTAETFPEPK